MSMWKLDDYFTATVAMHKIMSTHAYPDDMLRNLYT